MNITYKREMKHNYMIVEPNTARYDSYEVHMMAANCIEGLLKFRTKQVDEKKYYYYEITSKQPLSRLLSVMQLDAEKLSHLINGIARALDHMEVYLLKEEQILLDPDYIYIEPGEFRISLCLVPGYSGSFPEELSRLLQYLLGKVDHQDKDCVVMAYGLYQESLKENYGMEDLLRLTGKEGGREERIENAAFERERRAGIGDAMELQEPEYGVWEQEEPDDERYTGTQRQRERPDMALTLRGDKRQGNQIDRNKIVKAVCFFLVLAAGVPFAVWVLYGDDGLRRFMNLFFFLDAAGGLGLIVFTAVNLRKETTEKRRGSEEREREEREREGREREGRERKQEKKEPGKTRAERDREPENEAYHSPWQMKFLEETDQDVGKEPEEECQTVLLTSAASPSAAVGSRCLHSLKKEIPDIAVSYFPFLIGKQEGLVDYVLAEDAVSRLHIRIDREGEEYRITDLNSTNGTTVAGKLLESNETAAISPGEEVYIANLGFVFT